MKPSRLMSLIIVCIAGTGCPGMASENAPVQTIRTGRDIQLDGFLIDWQEKMRRQWTGSAHWYWDAAATPEGVAGYCTSPSAHGAWTIYVAAQGLSRPPREMVSTGNETPGGWYRCRAGRREGENAITIEWLIPWDSVAVDSSGAYSIHLAGRSDRRDSLAPLTLIGNTHALSTTTPLPRMLAVRFVVIAVMLGLFIGLQFTIRKKTRRRGSLRRSA